MDTVTILRRLWRLRLLVLLVAVLAIVAGLFVSFKLPSLETRKYELGVATARILVDTPASQVVDVAPKGSDALGVRAGLLANLMVDGVVKTAIAKRARLKPEELFGALQPADGTKPVLPLGAQPRSHLVMTRVVTTSTGEWLPIIDVTAQGPDAGAAKRLADAAVAGLRDFLDSKAAADKVPDANRLRIDSLGVAQAQDVVRGPRLAYSFVAAFLLFALGCGALLVLSGIVQGLKNPPKEDRSELSPELLGMSWIIEAASTPRELPAPEPVLIGESEPVEHPKAPTEKRAPRTGQPAPTPDPSSGWWGGGPGS